MQSVSVTMDPTGFYAFLGGLVVFGLVCVLVNFIAARCKK